ncbi:hypothetical protein CC2G_001520 [Coprinopsis cinerea AmutBmut pab1-1]|nr:hypothetical protein CC2G_001520 [Coprinopsis cinerea AmutBmut pab1-1]
MMRERAFPSTFEDDESEGLSDTYDERYVPPSLSRGRSYGQDISRSRSHSLATTRPGLTVGSPYNGSSAMQSWNESYLTNSNPLNIPGNRAYDIPPSGTSRYGSLGALARSPSNDYSSPTRTSLVGNGISRHQQPDVSNMSPFRRDVAQILLDDGPFRELWAGMNPPRDESGGGGGSGTTSRRHSVSVVQPRRGNIVGFNAPGSDSPEDLTATRPTFGSGFGRSGLMLDDDDLASDLGMLNINAKEPRALPPIILPASPPRCPSTPRSPEAQSQRNCSSPLSTSPQDRTLLPAKSEHPAMEDCRLEVTATRAQRCPATSLIAAIRNTSRVPRLPLRAPSSRLKTSLSSLPRVTFLDRVSSTFRPSRRVSLPASTRAISIPT